MWSHIGLVLNCTWSLPQSEYYKQAKELLDGDHLMDCDDVTVNGNDSEMNGNDSEMSVSTPGVCVLV